MKLTSVRPMIYSAEFDETIAFYSGILGFTIEEKNEDWAWASLSRDEVSIMLARPNAHTPFTGPAFTGSFYFNTDNVDALWQQLKGKASICYEPENFEWGMREFAIYDNNGYLLQFGQPINL